MNKTILMAALLILTSATMNAQLKREYSKPSNTASPVFSTTASPDIPTSVTFAGEKVSFDRLDMAERLDRELTGIIYGQTTTELCFKRANRYFPSLAKILKEQGVPLDFLYLAVTESSMDYNAYSSAKAAGMWQLLAGTARDYGLEVSDEVDERYDPEKATVAACKYLKAAYKKYGHWPTVAASYNAGQGGISRRREAQKQKSALELWLPEETARYMFRLLAVKMFFENPAAFGFNVPMSERYPYIEPKDVLTVNYAIPSLVDFALEHGTTYARLKEANLWLRDEKLTNKGNKTYQVIIP